MPLTPVWRDCKVQGCRTRGKLARGMCNRHYQIWKYHGDPNAPVKQRAARGSLAFDGQYFKVYGRRAHVVIAEAALGRKLRWPEQVHHVNGDKLDNRPENLVICPDMAYHKLLHKRTKDAANR